MSIIFKRDTSHALNIASLMGAVFSASCHAAAMYIARARVDAMSNSLEFQTETNGRISQMSYSIVGTGKTNKIMDAVIQGMVNEHIPTEVGIELTGYDTTLCYDVYRKKYFRSDIEEIKQAVQRLNNRGDLITLNHFLKELHLPYYGASGEILGWHGGIDVYYCSCLAEGGIPVFAVCYNPGLI